MNETRIETSLIPDIRNGGASDAFAEWLENNAEATTFTHDEIQRILKKKIKKAVFGTVVVSIFVIFLFISGVNTGEIIPIAFALLFGIGSVFMTKHALKEKNAIKSDLESGQYAAYIVAVNEKLICRRVDSDGGGSSSFYIRCGQAEIKKNSFNYAKEALSQYKAMDSNTRRNIIGSGNDALLQMRRLSEPDYIPNGFIIEIDSGLYKKIYERVIAVVCYGSDRKAVHFFEYR